MELTGGADSGALGGDEKSRTSGGGSWPVEAASGLNDGLGLDMKRCAPVGRSR